VEEYFALEDDPFLGFGGDDLLVVGIISLDEFGVEKGVAEIEGDLIFGEADGERFLVAEDALQFLHGFGGKDGFNFAALGEFDVLLDQREAAAVGGDEGKFV